jgi:hypothetical protein
MGPQAPSDGGVVNDDVIEGMISRIHQRVVMLLLRADAASAISASWKTWHRNAF